MGEFRDLLDAINDLQTEAKKNFALLGGYNKRRSISSSALDGICYFPAVADDAIPLDDCLTVSRALERNYATFVLTTLTMNPYMPLENGEINAANFVKQFHQNMRVGNSSSPDVNVVQGLYNLSESYQDPILDKYGIDYSVIEESAAATVYNIYQNIKSAVADRKAAKWNFTVEEMTSPSILNDIGKVRPVLEAGKTVFSGGPGQTSYINPHLNSGSRPTSSQPGRSNRSDQPYVYAPINVQPGRTPINNVKVDGARVKVGGAHVDVKPTINNNIKIPTPAAPRRTFSNKVAMNHLMDTEFKKANDLVPTMLHIRVYPTATEDVELPEPLDFVLGIKVTLHSVTSDAMMENLARAISTGNHFFDFIKWYTGETKFFKDFIFAIDQQKFDVKNSDSKDRGWFIASKRRKAVAKLLAKTSKQNLTPILTTIVSKDTLDTMARVYGLDVENSPFLITDMMEKLYLLGFITVNPATQRVDLIFDGHDTPQTVTLNTLMKEESRDDKKFKDMMRMMGRNV